MSLPLKIMAFAFKSTLALVWKLILLSAGCRFLKYSASRIWSFCLLFWCSSIVVLSVRIFRSCVVGHECFFKCWAIELVSERCIVSLLDRVVEVKPTYILLLSEIQSPRGHLNLYITLIFLQHPNIYIYIYIYTHTRVCVCVYVNNEKESDSMEKIEKQSNPKVMNLLRNKVDGYMIFLCVVVGWVLWYINPCRLFNAKSIFYTKSVLFLTIQFSMSTQFNCQEHFYFKLFSLFRQS